MSGPKRIIYFMSLSLIIGMLTLLSIDSLRWLGTIPGWAPAAPVWRVVLAIAISVALIGVIIIRPQFGKLWALTKVKIGFFVGMTLIWAGMIWVLIAIKRLFN